MYTASGTTRSTNSMRKQFAHVFSTIHLAPLERASRSNCRRIYALVEGRASDAGNSSDGYRALPNRQMKLISSHGHVAVRGKEVRTSRSMFVPDRGAPTMIS